MQVLTPLKIKSFSVTFNPGSGTLPSENRDGFYRSQWSVAVRQGNQFTQQDTIFVAYSDDVNIKVQYSYNNGGSGSWIEQTIAANIPTTSPLNVDIYNDSVFVTGFNSFTNQLFVAKRLLLAGPNTSWDFQYATTTEDRGSVFDSEVMATGANEKIYTVFDEKFSKKLYFGQKQNGVWTYNLISNPADGIKYAKLAVKPNGEPVVVYSEKTSTSSEVLKAAYRNGSTWTYDILDGNSYPREFSVAMNGNKLHTAYYDAKEGALKYAYADISAATPSWTVELLDSSSLAVGRYASIFVATDNTVHISYKDVLNNQLLYLRKGTSTNNLWVKDTISNSLLLESPTYSQVHYNELDHVVRIAYKDESSNKLKIYVLWNDGVHTTGEIITGTSSVIGNPFRMIVTNSPISNEPTVWVAYNDILPGGNSSEVRIIRTWGGMWTWQQLSINNNIGLVGGSFDFNERNGDFYIIGKKTKQDDMGLALLWAQDAVSVNLEEQTLNLATDLVLYPNPADNLVSFQLHLPNTQEVKFQLFDLNGKTTNIAFNETLNEGIHTKNFSVEHLPAGIYIAHWQVGNQVITRKLIIAK